jgi:hypothetical protein
MKLVAVVLIGLVVLVVGLVMFLQRKARQGRIVARCPQCNAPIHEVSVDPWRFWASCRHDPNVIEILMNDERADPSDRARAADAVLGAFRELDAEIKGAAMDKEVS